MTKELSKRLFPAQAGIITKITSKSGKRGAVIEALAEMYKKAVDALDWVICPTDEDENVIYAFQFFSTEEARQGYLAQMSDKDTAVADLLAEPMERRQVHIIYSGTETHPNLLIEPHQPGNVLVFPAKHGMSDDLFELTNRLHFNGDPDGPTDWILCRADDDYDRQMAFEFYRDDASFERHVNNPALDDGHNKVIDMIDMSRSMAKYKIYAKHSS